MEGIDPLVARLIELGGTAAVLWFVLLRLEAKLHENTKAINELTLKIGLLLDRSTRATQEQTAVTAQLQRALLVSGKISPHSVGKFPTED